MAKVVALSRPPESSTIAVVASLMVVVGRFPGPAARRPLRPGPVLTHYIANAMQERKRIG